MFVRGTLFIAGLIAVVPAAAQPASQQQAAQNSMNWDIFQKLYPRRAIAAKEEGSVGFVVTLDNKGDVADCRVTHSSGHPLLDQETCKIITLNAVFKPDPALGPSQTKTHEGMITWRLPNSTAAIAAPTVMAANTAPEKIVCKKILKTGSNASYERTCMTPTEWAKQSQESRAEFEDLQGKKGSTHGN